MPPKRRAIKSENSPDKGAKGESPSIKRLKTEKPAQPNPRSATPVAQDKFRIEYPNLTLPNTPRALFEKAKLVESPFKAKGAAKENELDQNILIEPYDEWHAMKTYSNFIIQEGTYRNNNFVFVQSKSTLPPKADADAHSILKSFWVARIIEVRASNPQKVYALVHWMYWPEELPAPKTRSPDQVSAKCGKQKYHGSHELIASNHMDVLDVLTFSGKADVAQWDQESDLPASQLFWRQSFCRQTQELSRVQEHCVCRGHVNPDVSMYICDNKSCQLWLHKDCLVDSALSKTYEGLVDRTNGITKSKGKAQSKTKAYAGKLLGDIIDDTEDDNPPMIVLKDLRPGHEREWMERIQCPKCSTELQ